MVEGINNIYWLAKFRHLKRVTIAQVARLVASDITDNETCSLQSIYHILFPKKKKLNKMKFFSKNNPKFNYLTTR